MLRQREGSRDVPVDRVAGIAAGGCGVWLAAACEDQMTSAAAVPRLRWRLGVHGGVPVDRCVAVAALAVAHPIGFTIWLNRGSALN